MRNPAVKDIDKNKILNKCFHFLCENGLENISMRKLCEFVGMGMGSIYYWFENKDSLILTATEYGINIVVDELFRYVYLHIDNLECIVITFSEIALKHKRELRFVYQVATSPKYDVPIRKVVQSLSNRYVIYAETFSKHFKCEVSEILPFVHLFISAVLDYVVWLDNDKFELEMLCILKSMKKIIINDN